MRVDAVDRPFCEEYLETIESLGSRRNARAVLRQVFRRAISLRRLTLNPTDDIELDGILARQERFEDEDLEAFVTACRAHPTHGVMVYVGFMLLLFTGQRPGDMLKMTWRQYDGARIRLRQQKTKKWVDIPAHAQLKALLDALPRSDLLIVTRAGKPISLKLFNTRFNEVRRAAKLAGKQARDLRRTAMVRMAEGGAEIQDIAAVTGHSIDNTRRILEVYLPRTLRMAERGVAKMADLGAVFSAEDLASHGK